jgi:hypothetical protein
MRQPSPCAIGCLNKVSTTKCTWTSIPTAEWHPVSVGRKRSERLQITARLCSFLSQLRGCHRGGVSLNFLAKNLHKRIFGLLIEPLSYDQVPPDMSLEWQLCRLVGSGAARSFDVEVDGRQQRIEFRLEALQLLRRGLDRAGLDGSSFPWPPGTDPLRAPYRGLRPLEPEDAAIFFGRDAAIVRALDRMRGMIEGGVERLLVVLGASGSGKSSFLRAGLWPRIARNDIAFLPLPVIRPETAPISGPSGLAAAIAGAFRRLGAPRAPAAIKEELHGGVLHRLLQDLVELASHRLVGLEQQQGWPAIVLPLDQAEELFNSEGVAEAELFMDLLASVLTPAPSAPLSRVIAVATVRSDRYPLLQAERRLLGVKQSLFSLPPLPVSEFKSVVEDPARRIREAGGHLTIDPALTEHLISDAKGQDALPLLAFTLERLYADFGPEGILTLDQYRNLGGMRASIEAAIAQALSDPLRPPAIPAGKEEQLQRLRAAFIPSLARVDSETGISMRRLARLDEIPEDSRPLVARLVSARLLTVDRSDGFDTIEVAHESLLRQWPPLTAWLQTDGENLKLVEGVERATSEWLRNGQHDAWLSHRGEHLSNCKEIN